MAIFNSFLYVYQRVLLFLICFTRTNPLGIPLIRPRLVGALQSKPAKDVVLHPGSRTRDVGFFMVFFHQNADHPRISPRLSTKR
jgi:hypothetical protein